MPNITKKFSNAVSDMLFGVGLRSVIRYFLLSPETEAYQSHIAHELRQRVRQTQYHLRRLTAVGFLISRPTRYRHYYRLNQHWPYLAALRKLFPAKL